MNRLSRVIKDDPVINLCESAVWIGTHRVLKEIQLKVYRGERVVLVGPSGAGKTTLLRRIYDFYSERSSFIHQDFALIAQLSSFQNVYMGRLDQYHWLHNLRNLIKPDKRTEFRVRAILENLYLEDKFRVLVSELSGGQQQRIAIARALFRNKKILLADEPVSSVDPAISEKILKLISENQETVVLSLHSMDLVQKFATRVIGIKEGRIKFDVMKDQINKKKLESFFERC